LGNIVAIKTYFTAFITMPQYFWTLDTLKKMPGQVRVTGADLVFRQDEQDLQDFWRRSRLFYPVNLVHPVQKPLLVSI
jgi:hypothetical protein